MTQEKLWLNKYQEVVKFIEINKRNPSKHDDEERGYIGSAIASASFTDTRIYGITEARNGCP